MLAVENLDPSRRATGLGGFNSFSSLGMAIGSFVGGLFAGWWGEWSAFLLAAAAQAVAFTIVRPRISPPRPTEGQA
jgi:MFS family permease